MNPEIIKVDRDEGFSQAVERGAQVLAQGGLVVFPTETVYGVAARADDTLAVERLRVAKGRATDRAFTVHIGLREDAARFVPEPSGLAIRFMRKGWPGPLSLIIPVDDPSRAEIMEGRNGDVLAGMYYEGAIGLRCPEDPVASALLRAVDVPVVAASANAVGQPPPSVPDAIADSFGDRIELLIDAGPTRYAKPSTIVRLSENAYEVVREGVFDDRIVKQLSMLRLLFVCTGNTCRSPMAAGLAAVVLASQLGCESDDLPDRGIIVESAGIAGGFGGAADHAVSVLKRRGIDLSSHASRAVVAEMIHQADHIFVMTRSHLAAVVSTDPSAEDRVRLLLGDKDIADPLGGSEKDYETCVESIEQGLRLRLREVRL